MLKELSSVQAYLPFIHAMLADPDFCDPMLATPAQLHQHLLDAHEDPAKHLFGTFDGGTLTGLFSVLVLPEEVCRNVLTAENFTHSRWQSPARDGTIPVNRYRKGMAAYGYQHLS